jgi:N-acetylmuramoyl-L-alanine amidase
MKQIPSPNFNGRAPGIKLAHIVLHYTGMTDAPAAIARMCDPAARVSAHYIIEENGHAAQLVAEEKRAWHAGQSFWRGITDLNSASIGIELVNPGHEFGYRAFPPAQITALKELMRGIIARHQMNAATAPIAHSDIAPSRKQDPGELFPWQELAKEGFGLWPTPTDYAPATETEITGLLGAVGYDTATSRDALLAFQRHYHPENLTGIANPETVARLRALKELMS